MSKVAMRVSVILPAAGRGSRMQSQTKKQFLKLDNKEIIIHTLEMFEADLRVKEIIVVAVKEDFDKIYDLCEKFEITKPITLVEGGLKRQDSVLKGLNAVDRKSTHVVIHDAARPFLTSDFIKDYLDQLSKEKGLVTAVPAIDTMKVVIDGQIDHTLNRAVLYNIQTPQGFEREMFLDAYDHALSTDYYGTDDASLVEHYGVKPMIFEGTYDNIKVTTRGDLDIGQLILNRLRGEI